MTYTTCESDMRSPSGEPVSCAASAVAVSVYLLPNSQGLSPSPQRVCLDYLCYLCAPAAVSRPSLAHSATSRAHLDGRRQYLTHKGDSVSDGIKDGGHRGPASRPESPRAPGDLTRQRPRATPHGPLVWQPSRLAPAPCAKADRNHPRTPLSLRDFSGHRPVQAFRRSGFPGASPAVSHANEAHHAHERSHDAPPARGRSAQQQSASMRSRPSPTTRASRPARGDINNSTV